MSSSNNGSGQPLPAFQTFGDGSALAQPQVVMTPQFQQLSSLGTTGGGWLNELKNLGYMPAGQSSWGNIGQTTMVPKVVTPSADGSQTGIGGSDPALIGLLQQRYGNKH